MTRLRSSLFFLSSVLPAFLLGWFSMYPQNDEPEPIPAAVVRLTTEVRDLREKLGVLEQRCSVLTEETLTSQAKVIASIEEGLDTQGDLLQAELERFREEIARGLDRTALELRSADGSSEANLRPDPGRGFGLKLSKTGSEAGAALVASDGGGFLSFMNQLGTAALLGTDQGEGGGYLELMHAGDGESSPLRAARLGSQPGIGGTLTLHDTNGKALVRLGLLSRPGACSLTLGDPAMLASKGGDRRGIALIVDPAGSYLIIDGKEFRATSK